MLRNLRPGTVVAYSAVSLAVLVLAGTRADAQVVKPFQIVGAGSGPDGLPEPGQPARPHWAIGAATYLGLCYGAGTVETDSAAPGPAPGHITGEFGSGSPFVFTGADGDRLSCWYGRTDHGAAEPGTFDLTILGTTADGSFIVKALFIAEFVVDPHASTGKFAGVTGSWIMYAESDPFVLGSSAPLFYSWEGEGWLTFPHGH